MAAGSSLAAPAQTRPRVANPKAEQLARKFRQQIHPAVALGLAIFFALMAVVSLVFGLFGKVEEAASRSWPTVPGLITSCALREVRNKPRRLPYEIVKYTLDVTYDYSVAGESYSGTRVVLTDNLWDEGSAQFRAANYAVGTTHPVYYNPDNPARAVLEPGNTAEGAASVNTIFGIVLPIGLVPIVLLLFYMYWMMVRYPDPHDALPLR